MKIFHARFFVFTLFTLLPSLGLIAQKHLLLDNDSLTSSLKTFLEMMDSNAVFKETHFLMNEKYDYYHSINSLDIVYEINGALKEIDLPFNHEELAEMTFVKCYNWTEVYDSWYITLVDKSGNHYIYHNPAIGLHHIKPYGVAKKVDYFYRLASNLYKSNRCGGKTEDYIVIGRIIDNKFVSFFSSQSYHTLDIVFFNDLLEIISNCQPSEVPKHKKKSK